jgi:hypothetical protein
MPRELTELIGRRGKPGIIVSDHGTEFTSTPVLAWSKGYRRLSGGIALHRTGEALRPHHAQSAPTFFTWMDHARAYAADLARC